MAGNIYAWSTTAASNATADSTINWAEGQLPGTVNDSSRAEMAVHAAFLADNNATSTTSGSGTAYTLTSNLTSTLATGLSFRLKMNATNSSGAATLNVTPSGGAAFGAKAIKVYTVGGETDPTTGMIQSNGIYTFNYDSAANSGSGAWMLLNPTNMDISRINGFNCGVAVSASTSALTIAIKTLAGSDPSASDPVFIQFRSATATSAVMSPLAITAATSLVVSGGSTLGTTSAEAFRLWVVGFNDGGTFRLGVVQNRSGTGTNGTYLLKPLVEGIASSTAEGGAGAADSAGVIYTGSAVSSKAMRILGYAEWSSSGVTSAGTWTTTNLSTVQMVDQSSLKPGDFVQFVSSTATPTDTTTSTTFIVSSATATITPSSAANILRISANGILLGTNGDAALAQLSRGNTANTNMIGSTNEAGSSTAGATGYSACSLLAHDLPNTASSQIYALQFKSAAGNTVGFGNAGRTWMEVTEIMT